MTLEFFTIMLHTAEQGFFERRLEPLFPQALKEFSIWGNSAARWCFIAGLIILALLLRKIPGLLIRPYLKRLEKGKNGSKLASLIETELLPVIYYVVPLLFFTLVTLVVLNIPDSVRAFLIMLNRAFYLILTTYLLVRLAGLLIFRIGTKGIHGEGLSKGSAHFYKKLIEICGIFICLLGILSVFGVNVTSLVAGLGLGGLAVSLAAQDSLSNLIAGLFIMWDKVVTAGEEIRIGDVEGTVVSLGLRSSKIRAYDRTLIAVPNKVLAGQNLINITRSDRRRVMFTFTLPLDITNEELAELEKSVRSYWTERPKVKPEDGYCGIDGILEQGIQFLVRYYVEDPSYAAWQEEKTAFLQKMWSVLRSMGLNKPFRSAEIKLNKDLSVLPGESFE